ncbi:GNAT family N-acetyltransferase [Arthrobacter sp. CAN_A214]|uniref:GNAT family N-acetyltransferase n=1 Tax=Arthrobacter sp. CAN_A214 TaxID=2787720 RepID=UPI002FF3DCE5
MSTPTVPVLDRVAQALGEWQYDEGPLHLHPGDLGWYSLKGADATAAAVRTWSRGEKIVAVGLLDGPQLLRMALNPALHDDDELARQLLRDIDDPQNGVLNAGDATIEARGAARFMRLLAESGWQPDAPWIPLHRDLSEPVQDAGVRVEVINPDQADRWIEVHWSAFRGTPFSAEDRRRFLSLYQTMAAGPFYNSARSLAVLDGDHNAVAVATVWSAGAGRPGLVEPMGVHQGHRGRGYGTAITVAAAAALQEMGSSSAIVCAESSNAGAVATYVAAGFTAHQQIADLHRAA